MVEVTKLNDEKITINAELIELVEEIPDTMITLTTGRKILEIQTQQYLTVCSRKKENYNKGLDIISKAFDDKVNENH